MEDDGTQEIESVRGVRRVTEYASSSRQLVVHYNLFFNGITFALYMVLFALEIQVFGEVGVSRQKLYLVSRRW